MPNVIAGLQVGEKFEPYVKTFTSVDLFAYGAATWDWAKAHYDAAYAKTMKVENIFVDGQQFGALFAKRVIDRFGPKTFIAKLSIRYRMMVFVDETVTGEGEIVRIDADEDGGARVEIKQRFTKNGAIVSECTILARLRD